MEGEKLSKVVRARLSEKDLHLAREVLEKRETLSELIRTGTRRLIRHRLAREASKDAARRLEGPE